MSTSNRVTRADSRAGGKQARCWEGKGGEWRGREGGGQGKSSSSRPDMRPTDGLLLPVRPGCNSRSRSLSISLALSAGGVSERCRRRRRRRRGVRAAWMESSSFREGANCFSGRPQNARTTDGRMDGRTDGGRQSKKLVREAVSSRRKDAQRSSSSSNNSNRSSSAAIPKPTDDHGAGDAVHVD